VRLPGKTGLRSHPLPDVTAIGVLEVVLSVNQEFKSLSGHEKLSIGRAFRMARGWS